MEQFLAVAFVNENFVPDVVPYFLDRDFSLEKEIEQFDDLLGSGFHQAEKRETVFPDLSVFVEAKIEGPGVAFRGKEQQ